MSVSQRRMPACTAGLYCTILTKRWPSALSSAAARAASGTSAAGAAGASSSRVSSSSSSPPTASVGVLLQQALVGGQHGRGRSSPSACTQAAITSSMSSSAASLSVRARGIGVADLDQRLAVARLGGLHALVERFHGGLVALGLRGMRAGRECERKTTSASSATEATNQSGMDDNLQDGGMRQGSVAVRRRVSADCAQSCVNRGLRAKLPSPQPARPRAASSGRHCRIESHRTSPHGPDMDPILIGKAVTTPDSLPDSHGQVVPAAEVRQPPRPGRRRHRHRQDRDADDAGRRLLAHGRAGVHGRREGRRRRPGGGRRRQRQAPGSASTEIGIADYANEASPVVFWDLYGKLGHPVRTTVSEIGPDPAGAHARTQRHPVRACSTSSFKLADDRGLLLLDLDDLRALLGLVAASARTSPPNYGLVSTQSIGAIQRALLRLEQEGGEVFFGEPALELADLMRTTADGRGVIGILAADQLILKPRLYSSFLLWLLSELFETPAGSRRPRQAQAGVRVRRGAPAVRRRAAGAAAARRAGGAADPLQGRGRVLLLAVPRRRARRHPRPARQPRAARAARVHAARPEGGEDRRRDLRRQSEAGRGQGHLAARHRRGAGVDAAGQGRADAGRAHPDRAAALPHGRDHRSRARPGARRQPGRRASTTTAVDRESAAEMLAKTRRAPRPSRPRRRRRRTREQDDAEAKAASASRSRTPCSAPSAARAWSRPWPSRPRAPSAARSAGRSCAVCSAASSAAVSRRGADLDSTRKEHSTMQHPINPAQPRPESLPDLRLAVAGSHAAGQPGRTGHRRVAGRRRITLDDVRDPAPASAADAAGHRSTSPRPSPALQRHPGLSPACPRTTPASNGRRRHLPPRARPTRTRRTASSRATAPGRWKPTASASCSIRKASPTRPPLRPGRPTSELQPADGGEPLRRRSD